MVATVLLLLLLLLRPAGAPPSRQQHTNRTADRWLTAARRVQSIQTRSIGAYEPVQVHLGYTGEDAGSVVVQWVTKAMASGSYVQWGLETTSRQRDAANSTECEPGQSLYPGWSGVLHQARMDGIVSRQTYYYRVGSDEDMSPQRAFTAPGYAEPEATMLVAADIGTGENALLLWSQLRQEVAMADVLMIAGGTAYAGVSMEDYGTQDTWDDFFEQAEEVLTLLPASVAVGTHDAYSDPPFRPLNLRFPMGPSARSIAADGSTTSSSIAGFPNWYAYYMGPMRVVVVSTEHCTASPACVVQDAAAEKEQLAWLDKELGNADARRTKRRPWVVLVGHRPLYSSSQEHSPGDAQLRVLMEPMIFRHGVDIALWGHTRQVRTSAILSAVNASQRLWLTTRAYGTGLIRGWQYERTWPVWAERIIFGGASSTSVTDNGQSAGGDGHNEELSHMASGPVHVNVGPGGVAGLSSEWEHHPWAAKTAQPEWSPGGYAKIVADSACGLNVQYAGLDGEIQDEFGLYIGAVEPIEVTIDLIPWGDRAWDVWDR